MLQRIAKFGLIGILNTVIDFTIFNILSGKRIGWGKIPANIVSTTTAMIFSFVFNKNYVFGAHGGNIGLQIVEFVVVTLFGLYVLQNLVIWFMTEVWTLIPDIVFAIVSFLRLGKLLKQDFVAKNTAKVFATVVSLVWNFILYSAVVFKQ